MTIETLELIREALHGQLAELLCQHKYHQAQPILNALKEVSDFVPTDNSVAATAKIVEDVFGEPKWFPCLSYTQLQVGDMVQFINDRGTTIQDIVNAVDGNETVLLINHGTIKKRIISRFCPIQQQ